MSTAPIVVEHVSHHYGEGRLRRQVLFDVSVEIGAGEIVILTGPSGSGKTTLLTLIGALRSTQEGSLRVLGQQLRGAREATLANVRRRIGYVFQAHNLLDSLSARQNVELSVQLAQELSPRDIERRAEEALDAVGLGDRLTDHPSDLSGGQRQRVAIARALAGRPEILLADEPTASLDRETGRGVVELIQKLAKKDGVTVVFVTHDSRILDIADRILALEDGRLSSLLATVTSEARSLLQTLARDVRGGELAQRVVRLDVKGFEELLRQATAETERLLELVDLVQGEAFGSLLEQVVVAFTTKVAEILGAEQARLSFLEDHGHEFWSLVPCGHGRVREVRRTIESSTGGGAAGAEGLLSVSLVDTHGATFGVVELAGKKNGRRFDADDEQRLRSLARSLGLILESWWRMSCACRSSGIGRPPPCCEASQDSSEARSPQDR